MKSKLIEKKLNVDDNAFDIIRLVCAFTVFWGHFITHFSINFVIADYIGYFIRGVPVFFLLSGFLVARSLERYSTREFWIRRFVRIYPAMWVCIALNTMIILAIYAVKPSAKEFIIYIVTQFTVFQFFTGGWLSGYGVGVPNGVLWTIAVDIQFYVLAVWLAKVLKNKSMKTWVLAIGGVPY